jgi:hypothetical protein
MLRDSHIGIIDGGAMMNPSVADVVAGIEAVSAQQIVLFPNDKNIFLTAQEAAKVSYKNVYIVPTESMPQCLSVAVGYDDNQPLQYNIDNMTQALMHSSTLLIGRATKETKNNKHVVHAGDYIAISSSDKAIIASGEDIAAVIAAALVHLIEGREATELVACYRGKDVPVSTDVAIHTLGEQQFPDLEFQFYDGGQPVYAYLVLLEA